MRKSLQIGIAVILFTVLLVPVFAAGTAAPGMPTLVLDSSLWSPPAASSI